MKARIFILQLLLLITFQNYAQEILGVVTDRKKEPIINASVRVTQAGILKGNTVTDYDGKFSVKPLEEGLYDVTVSYTGMQSKTFTQVVVSAGGKTEVNFVLQQTGKELKEVFVNYDHFNRGRGYRDSKVLSRKEIVAIPTNDTAARPMASPIYQKKRNGVSENDTSIKH